MKIMTLKTFEKKTREGRLEVHYELIDYKDYFVVEVKGKNGPEMLRVNK